MVPTPSIPKRFSALSCQEQTSSSVTPSRKKFRGNLEKLSRPLRDDCEIS